MAPGRLRLAALAALCSAAQAQTGFCTGNLDGTTEPDVACLAGYAAAASSASVERGAGNAAASAGAQTACCVAVSCTTAACGDGKVLAAGVTSGSGAVGTDAQCCAEDYAGSGQHCAGSTNPICVDCISPEAYHGGAESGDGGFQITTTSNADGTVTIVLANQVSTTFQGFLMKATSGYFTNVPATAQYKDCSAVGGGIESPGGRAYHSVVVHRGDVELADVTITWHPAVHQMSTARGEGSSRIVVAAIQTPTVWFPVGIRAITSVIPDWSTTRAAGDHCSGGLCTNCISPEFQLGAGQSGNGGYTLTASQDAAVPNVVSLTLRGQAAFRGFLLKTNVGAFEWLPAEAQFKVCSATADSSADSPGGSETGQAVVKINDAGATELTFDLAFPASTTAVRVTTVVIKDSSNWYGWIGNFPIETAADSGASTGNAAALAEITLTGAMADFVTAGGNAAFETEMATALGVPDRVQVVERRAGSVIVQFAVKPGSGKTPSQAMTDLTTLVAAGSQTFNGLAASTDSLRVLSVGGVCAVGAGVTVDEGCIKCKSAWIVALMFLAAVFCPLSTVLLCSVRKLRRRKTRESLDAEYETKCQGYDKTTEARQMSVSELKAKMAAGDNLYIIDTRGEEEHLTSCIEGAHLLVPTNPANPMVWEIEPETALKDWPPSDGATVVCHCTAGYRSGFAAVDLEKRLQGREVWNLHGGIIQFANEGGSIIKPGDSAKGDKTTGQKAAQVNTFNNGWADYVHTGDGEGEYRVWFQGYQPPDNEIHFKGNFKLFLSMFLLMLVVLLFTLVDIPAVYTTFIESLQDMGPLGPIVAGLAWIPVCLFFVPGMILSLSTGFAFDFLPAFICTLLGATVGSTCAAISGRYLARDAVEDMLVGWPKFAAVDAAIEEEGFKVVLLLRLSPVIPFNVLNYALGTTGVPIPQFFLASLIGMAPGTAMFIYIGSTLRNLADALRGDLSGGDEDGDSSSGTIRLIALIVGLIATVVVTVFITIKAKKTLATYVHDDPETAAKTGFEAAQELAEETPAPKQLEPPDPWKIPAGCVVGWLVLLLSIFLLVFGVFYKERVDFAPAGVSDDMFITAEDLNAYAAGTVTILDARGSFGDHIPGAQHAAWQDFAVGGPESTKSVLKPVANLESLLSTRGVSATRQVVVYGDWANEWGEEGRLLWMLDYLGHPDVKVLYGGIDAWAQPAPNGKGYATSSAASAALTGGFVSPGLQEQVRATSDEIAAAVQLQLCNYIFFDTRTKAEFEGSAAMYGAARDGRIPNALWYPWMQVFDTDGGNLRDKQTIRAELEAMGVTDNSIIVSYCTGGIRSGFMYMVLRWLEFDGTGTMPLAQNYDGSWWEYASTAHAIEVGAAP